MTSPPSLEPRPCRDALERVDFDDPRVIKAIRKAADSFDEDKHRDRLEQFETRCTTGLLEFVD